jgi:hypothetical protein
VLYAQAHGAIPAGRLRPFGLRSHRAKGWEPWPEWDDFRYETGRDQLSNPHTLALPSHHFKFAE